MSSRSRLRPTGVTVHCEQQQNMATLCHSAKSSGRCQHGITWWMVNILHDLTYTILQVFIELWYLNVYKAMLDAYQQKVAWEFPNVGDPSIDPNSRALITRTATDKGPPKKTETAV